MDKIVFDDMENLQNYNRAMLRQFIRFLNKKSMNNQNIFSVDGSTITLDTNICDKIIEDALNSLYLRANYKNYK